MSPILFDRGRLLAGAVLTATLATAVLTAACHDDTGTTGPTGSGYAGFLYTSTNDPTGNGIVALGRKSDGSLAELPGSPYRTGAVGNADADDFDTQWALRIVGDYLLAVNAGKNPTNGSLSVFKINRTDGSLAQVDQDPSTPAMDNIDSRGIRAVSIAAAAVGGTSWIVVANQHSLPGFLGDPPVAAGGPIVASALRNLAVFTMDPATGVLTFRNIGPTYSSGEYGGPNTVRFNATGTKLAVTTEGIFHAETPNPDTTVQRPGRLFIYSFAGGVITQTGMFQETGLSGETGALWSPNGQYVYVTNLNLNSTKEDNSVTVHDGTTAAKLQNFAAGDRNEESCWSLVSRDGTKFYAVGFNHNLVSVFDIGADGKLTKSLTPNYVRRGGNVPDGDAKDLYEAGSNLYVLGALKTHTVSVFNTSASGALAEQASSLYAVPSSAGKTSLQQAFLGLTGFEK